MVSFFGSSIENSPSVRNKIKNRLPVYASVHDFGTGTANIGNKTPPERNGEKETYLFDLIVAWGKIKVNPELKNMIPVPK